MAGDLGLEGTIDLEQVCHFVERFLAVGPDVGLVDIEVDAIKIDAPFGRSESSISAADTKTILFSMVVPVITSTATTTRRFLTAIGALGKSGADLSNNDFPSSYLEV